MIDPETEELLSPREVASLPAFKRGGKPAHISSVWRWFSRGCRSTTGQRVKLESLRVPPGGVVTSRQAVSRFINALNNVAEAPPTKSRRAAVDHAEAELRSAGIA